MVSAPKCPRKWQVLAFCAAVLCTLTLHSHFSLASGYAGEVPEVEKQSVRSTLDPIIRVAHGGWSGGGGGAIGCFSSVRDRQNAFDHLGRLKPKARHQLIILTTLDLWEVVNPRMIQNFFQPTTQQTAMDLLVQTVVPRVQTMSPVFAKQLLRAIHLVDLRHWQTTHAPGLPLLKDFLPAGTSESQYFGQAGVPALPAHCAYIQMVIRYVKNGPTAAEQKIFLDYDADLIARMRQLSPSPAAAVLSEAFLILHEALYFMAENLSQLDSVNARKITAHLLSEDWYWDMERIYQVPAEIRVEFRRYLMSFGFDRYPELFDKPSALLQPHLMSYQSFVKKITAWSETNESSLHTKYIDYTNMQFIWIFYRPLAIQTLVQSLDAAESFWLLAHAAMAEGYIKDVDSLRTSESPAEIAKLCTEYVPKTKRTYYLHSQNYIQYKEANKLVKKAETFCHTIKH